MRRTREDGGNSDRLAWMFHCGKKKRPRNYLDGIVSLRRSRMSAHRTFNIAECTERISSHIRRRTAVSLQTICKRILKKFITNVKRARECAIRTRNGQASNFVYTFRILYVYLVGALAYHGIFSASSYHHFPLHSSLYSKRATDSSAVSAFFFLLSSFHLLQANTGIASREPFLPSLVLVPFTGFLF